MSSFFQRIKVKKDNHIAAKNLVKTAEKKAALPDDFFEQILTCEIQLKNRKCLFRDRPLCWLCRKK